MTPAFARELKPIPIAERILDCFPGGTYALSALLRLLDIVESETVPTAAVECRVQPRLLINPKFVKTHARTSEKLLMLVMHELHHVLLGHTTLFPTITSVHNFIFDSVINGIICRMFPAQEYTSFLTDYYDAARFPECLLRPPPGWPDRAQTPKGILDLGAPHVAVVRDVHAALYSDTGASYQEVFKVLPRLVPKDVIKGVPLLGGHGEGSSTAGKLEDRSPVLFDIVRSIVEHWPQPPDPIQGRSLADILRISAIQATRSPSNRALLRKLIHKVAGSNSTGAIRRVCPDQVAAPTPIPALDRRSAVMRSLGYEPLLQVGAVPWRRTIRTGERVHVYMDVSGSMEAVKKSLYGAVLDCREYVHPTVHLFSTTIADISLDELRRGVCKSTGGTNIACVASHMARNRVRRSLIVTDGWVGTPRGQHRTTLADSKLAVAFLGTTASTNDLADVANFTTILSNGA
ncbi:MAG: hypothetical protein EXQ83_13860 [Xanthobacteraceae bacterium]|nr:hypothetical protein [Xanthobacteraceae bacterium]